VVEAAATRAGSAAGAAKPARRKLAYLEQREYDTIETTIAAAETALQAAVADSENPGHASDAARLIELLAVVEQRRADVDHLYARWAELEAKLAGGEVD
jgi:ATP-binding cassette subfamily F protein uup